MRFIKQHLSLWRIVLIVGVAAIAIPIAVRVRATGVTVVTERQDFLDQQTTANNEDADAKHSNELKAAVGEGVAPPQDDYYDRRREYWDRRVERRLDHLEDEDEDADAKDSKAAKEKDSKDAADDEDEADDDVEREVKAARVLAEAAR